LSYQVLARKWRPRSFADMVGQQHVLRALIHALDGDRLHHAFLFTGTRGVGKTTIARILAKSLNCEQGVSSTPCGLCAACREIDEGRFVDMIEVDAASRTKVEDTRELLENVSYVPTRGRYKVYLIDEVHMLSEKSFNALLKTLEEPPAHVKFLLATTDPQKLPITVLSRCLQFNLKRLSVDQIAGQIRHILSQEGIVSDHPAILALARAADGSMRDGLSLLDQAIGYGGGELRLSEVEAMLGTIDRSRVVQLLNHLAEGAGDAMFAEVAALAELAADFHQLLADLAHLLQRLALMQQVPSALEADESAILADMASRVAPELVQLWYQIAITSRRDLVLAPDERLGFEMALLRMLAFRRCDGGEVVSPPVPPRQPAVSPPPAAAPRAGPPARDRYSSPPPTPPVAVAASPSAAMTEMAQAPVASAAVPVARQAAPAEVAQATASLTDRWHGWVEQLRAAPMVLQLARNSSLLADEGALLRLACPVGFSSIRSAEREQVLAQALSKVVGRSVRVQFEVQQEVVATPQQIRQQVTAERQAAALASLQADPLVGEMVARFDAELIVDSVTPLTHE
jgi:DNA polymerase III subunit gamma/tau